ncbi:MAG: hypothetical protein HKN30_08930 [Sulfitobacter sp.]|nr:hypothetical protein [Sulfitobacter sp.]
MPGLFTPAPAAPAPVEAPLPATEKQIAYAASLAAKAGAKLPEGIAADRAALSRWIDAHKAPKGRFSDYPSSKQVAFAERIARLKRGQVPPECFRDRALMSRWIDSNKPR